jgi:hypothetical protein
MQKSPYKKTVYCPLCLHHPTPEASRGIPIIFPPYPYNSTQNFKPPKPRTNGPPIKSIRFVREPSR